MQIEIWVIGKNDQPLVEKGVQENLEKIKYFQKVTFQVFKSSVKGKQEGEVFKKNEGELILSKLSKDDFLVLLDEKGKLFTSRQFAEWIENYTLHYSSKKLIFLIGGAYGFHEDVYARANFKISISPMTFSHQLIRIIFTEQLFRAYTIINNHPYHND